VTAWLEAAGLADIKVRSLAPETHDDRQQLTVSLWLGRRPPGAGSEKRLQQLERIGS
jgi:hypothetical protein